MCGIAGFNFSDSRLIKRMNEKLKHRGPDDSGSYIDDLVSLGHRRLAVIDLSARGKQPMSNEDGSIWLIFNGEIYNFKELRAVLEKKGHSFKSDTDSEVIIHCYEEYGFDCLKKLNGMWAFCIYDSNKKILFLSRDRLGIKPLYYSLTDGKFIFASEIKAILEYEELKKEINWNVFNAYISMRYCFGRDTIFNNIKRLLPGERLIFDLKKKKLKIERYWKPKIDFSSSKDEKTAVKKLLSLLKDSIKKRLIADVPLGIFLSGGMDSSTLVALMRDLDRDAEIKTYSIGFEYGEKVNELKYASKIAEFFGTEHKEFVIGPESYKALDEILYHADEPMADPALIPLYHLSKNAKKEVTVVLTGDGGDEIFAGYDQHFILNLSNYLSKLPSSENLTKLSIKLAPKPILDKIYKHSSNIGKEKISARVSRVISALRQKDYAKAYFNLLAIFTDDERKKLVIKPYFRDINYEHLNENYFQKPKDFMSKILYYDQLVLLPESFLMKTDKMTMAHGLEARVPFLDYRLVNFSYSIDSSLKLNRNKTKYILRKAMSKYLPKDIVWRKKQTVHVPIEEWISIDLEKEFLCILKENRQKIFNQSYIEKIFKNYRRGKLYYGRQLWNIICWIKWYNLHFL